ncbi:MAG: ATP-binding cassette domain-containing protein [Sandaracinaceae bacterium]|nr:ATP-binding cassette domain-containing protein [Sandaracinaceae bacterium]
MSRFALRLSRVHKRYGRTVALDGIDLDVPRGALLGLVGPNGAGKTTLFGVVGGMVRADAGAVDVLGEGPFDPERHAGRVTLVPQDCELNPHSSARQLLTFYARLQGAGKRQAERDADRVLELVRLSDRAGSRVRQLSHGDAAAPRRGAGAPRRSRARVARRADRRPRSAPGRRDARGAPGAARHAHAGRELAHPRRPRADLRPRGLPGGRPRDRERPGRAGDAARRRAPRAPRGADRARGGSRRSRRSRPASTETR